MEFEYFIYDQQDSILKLIMNRPQKRNAWNWQMHTEYLQALKMADDDDAIRAVILTGAPPAFSAGTDLSSFEDGSTRTQLEKKGEPPFVVMRELKKPLIAAINGPAIGMGLTITFMCDIRIAAESAKMSMRFTQVGVIPEFASRYMLPRIVGLGRALDLCLTARMFEPTEALNMGLVSQVVPDEQLMQAAMDVAASITEKKEHVIRKTREIFYHSLDIDFYETVRRESKDFIEAVEQTYE